MENCVAFRLQQRRTQDQLEVGAREHEISGGCPYQVQQRRSSRSGCIKRKMQHWRQGQPCQLCLLAQCGGVRQDGLAYCTHLQAVEG